MSLKLFKILTETDQQIDFDVTPILININHIISIKPINMMVNESLINGYWIRTSNGKKYRATDIPEALSTLLDDSEKKNLNPGIFPDVNQDVDSPVVQ